MEAGRELDILFQEKVIGWARHISADNRQHGLGIVYGWHDKDGVYRGIDVEDYSTDIAAAWHVVERLHDLGIGIIIKSYPPGMAFRYSTAIPGKEIGTTSETGPLAICLTALKAVGVEV